MKWKMTVRSLVLVSLLAFACVGCARSDDSDGGSTTAASAATTTTDVSDSPGGATTSTTQSTTTTDSASQGINYGPRARNLRITGPDKQALLRTANAWKREHESEYAGPNSRFAGKAMTGPVPGGTYHAGLQGHEYALAGFALDGWEVENQYLFARPSLPRGRWQVLRLDTASDVSGVCSLPHLLLIVWRADMLKHCTPAPLRGSSVDVAEVAKAGRFIQPPATNVLCRITMRGGKANVDCIDEQAHQFASITAGARQGRTNNVTREQMWQRMFEPAARSATLGLDEAFEIRAAGRAVLTCTAPSAREIDCRTPDDHGITLGGEAPLFF